MQKSYNLIGIGLIIGAIILSIIIFKKDKYNPLKIRYKTKDDFYNATGYFGPFAPIPPKIYLNITKVGFDNPYDDNSGYQLDISNKSLFKTKANVYINGKKNVITEITKDSKGLIPLSVLNYDENSLISLQLTFDDEDKMYGTNFIYSQIMPRDNMEASILLSEIKLTKICN